MVAVTKCFRFVPHHILFAAVKRLSVFVGHVALIPLAEITIRLIWLPEENWLSQEPVCLPLWRHDRDFFIAARSLVLRFLGNVDAFERH